MALLRNRKLLVVFSLVLVCLNLSWQHQTILIQMVPVRDYYDFGAREPFIYRILPALLYRAVTLGRGEIPFGLNEPLSSSFTAFQFLLDTVCLLVSFVCMTKIVRAVKPDMPPATALLFSFGSFLAIVIFGFFMVPNRALFYPYDFPDLCFASLIFYLCIRLKGRSEYLLPVVIFLGTMNKETAPFYGALYLIYHIADKQNRRRTFAVWALVAVAFIAARALVGGLVDVLALHRAGGGVQYEMHIAYTLEQLRNPLFFFAMLNIFSYLYIPLIALRKRLDAVDVLILCLIGVWVVVMATVGIVRELRIFVPASLLMFILLARHLDTIAGWFGPGRHAPAERAT
jgi:hypothetical protein